MFPADFCGGLDAHNDIDYQIDYRDKKKNQPSVGLTGHLDKDIEIEDWNNRRPAGLAGLFEDLPQKQDHKDRYRQIDNQTN